MARERGLDELGSHLLCSLGDVIAVGHVRRGLAHLAVEIAIESLGEPPHRLPRATAGFEVREGAAHAGWAQPPWTGCLLTLLAADEGAIDGSLRSLYWNLRS